MALPERKTTPTPVPHPLSVADTTYLPGGHVGQMRADLAHRLARQGISGEPVGASPAEELIRFISVAGGYAALLAAYAGVALLLRR